MTPDELRRLALEVDRTIRLAGWRNFEHSVVEDPETGEVVIGFLLEYGPDAGGLEVEVRGRSDAHAIGELRARLHAIGRPDGD